MISPGEHKDSALFTLGSAAPDATCSKNVPSDPKHQFEISPLAIPITDVLVSSCKNI